MVVLVIISILTGLVLSVISNAREAARRTQCTANLRQIGLVLEKYRDDHGEYPRQPLTSLGRDSQILRCPSDRTKVEPDTPYTSYEYALIDPSPSVAQRAEQDGVLVLCRHHSRTKALIVREGGAVKFMTMPDYLVE